MYIIYIYIILYLKNVSLFQGLPQIFKPSLRGHSLLQFIHQSFSLDETIKNNKMGQTRQLR